MQSQNTKYPFIVSILDRQKLPRGMGILVDRDTVITCAHVVNEALGRESDVAERPKDDARIDIYFPFSSDDRKGKVRDWFPPEKRSLQTGHLRASHNSAACKNLEVAKFSSTKPGIEFKVARRTGSTSPLQWGYGKTGDPSEGGYCQVEAIPSKAFLEAGHSGSPALC